VVEGSSPGPRRAAGRVRAWAAPALVLVFLAAVVAGGHLAQGALADEVEPAVQVAPGVRVQPLSGWRPAEGRGDGAVLLSRGSGNLAVIAVDPAGSPAELAAWYARERLAPGASGLVVSRPLEPVRLPSGLVGARFAYQGQFEVGERATPLRGEVTTVTGPGGTGVVFDAWALPEVFQYERGDVHRMIETAEIR
jgi:hypothetical protein